MNRWLSLPLVLLVVGIAACGSSKPGYCGDRQTLRDAVDQLSAVNLRSDGIGALRDQLQTVRADAKTAAASAKSDFPDETAAIGSAVDSLSAAVQALPSSPSAGDIASVGVAVAATVKAVKAFDAATSDKC